MYDNNYSLRLHEHPWIALGIVKNQFKYYLILYYNKYI